MFAGRVVVIDISERDITFPIGSTGAAFVMIAHRAKLAFPTGIVISFRGFREYLSDRPCANEFGE